VENFQQGRLKCEFRSLFMRCKIAVSLLEVNRFGNQTLVRSMRFPSGILQNFVQSDDKTVHALFDGMGFQCSIGDAQMADIGETKT